MSAPGQDLKDAVGRKASIGQTISAVAWSFFGVRRGRDHENDMAKLNPVHVIIAGVLGAALFVLVLVLVVRWVISSGVAAA
ncbi:DUF2970 domain-containing protein [Pelomonas sp. UHG3]|uniref:DUF2970 domain-containing protein n=1 Tax=Roseateles hydrophilus TaxID=2975054 RepID=A0ACC6C5D0_9BURK|nr:DUF2970 domain-containing protein [Pelomonas sp. UHG3]MCY4743590.1 DUF2970 domain-containing protein [Pelomonas sp. UHG3]